MPVNQNAEYRYRILDRCFSNFHRKYTFDDLLDVVNEHLAEDGYRGISVRQLRDDFKAIRNMLPEGVYLDAKQLEDKKCYYRYSERDVSIFNNELSANEVQELRTTIDMLSRFRGIPGHEWLEEVVSNLEYRFGVKSNSANVVSFEQNEDLKGLEYLTKVIDAAVNHTPLTIHYKSYRGVESVSVLHPYHVKQFSNRWFLFGLDDESNKIANRALDRIQRITKANVSFKANTDIDFAHYFDDIVGVSVPEADVPKETVVLRFSENRFPYVTSKPIHSSQKVLNEEECTISLNVKITRELEQQIFSFGPDVEVLSPESFRVQFGEKIKEISKKYFPVQKECTDNS
jgi:predicted DNA-binding transcriptional regulator YafY